MITPDGKHCTVQGFVVWDGITRPEMDTPVGKPKHSLKIVMHPQQADVTDLQTIAMAALTESEFKGVLPPGANWAIGQVGPGDAFNKDGRFNGWLCVNAGTYQGAPQVYDANGVELQAMGYSSLLYPGCLVDVLVNSYAYNNKQKGVAAGLSGVRIVDATCERLNVGGAGIDAGSVFGGGAPAPVAAPVAVAAPAPAPVAVAAPAPAPAPVAVAVAAPAPVAGMAPNPVPGAPIAAPAPVAGPATAAPIAAPVALSAAPAVGNVVPGQVVPAANYLPQ